MKILVADDNSDARVMLKKILEADGHTVRLSGNGAEALNAARESAPDLIISDILMPVMDGFRFCREVRSDPALRETPFIFYTATYTDESDELLALSLGADRFLRKPVDSDAFLAAIRQVTRRPLEGRRGPEEPPPVEIEELFNLYSERLVAKLEKKTQDLEREIAGRKRAEEALGESEKRYYDLFENANDIIYTHDLAGNFTMINKAAERITGYTRDEALSMNIDSVLAPESRNIAHQMLSRKIQEGGQTRYDLEMVCKNGRRVPVEISTRIIYKGGKAFGVQGIARDISERMRAAEEKQKLEHQLRTAQKMEAVGTLAGGIAHDFNNALTVVIGFGEMLRLRITNDPKAISDLDEILLAANRAAVLTRQLLTFARRQIIEPVHLDLNEVMTGFVKLLRKVTRENIVIKTSPAENPVMIRADRGQVEQVLMNLSLNARDAMPEGGRLVIEAGVTSLEEGYLKQYPDMKAGRYAVLSVSDTGTGMDEKTRERIFEPFFTTKGPAKGTGLGLAMVYGIVKQHDGFIHVYSEQGKGTTFQVYFPEVDAPADAKVVVSQGVVRGGSETILLAEDNESVRQLTEQTLISYGYKVLIACDGEEAVDLFRRHGKEIAMAVLDVVMPKMGGKEAYDAIAKISSGLKVLYLSGYSANAIHESFVLLPGISFLQKPFSPDSLARKVREILDRK